MSGVRRSRWAAIGAAVAVALGAGGLTIVNASSAPSSFVSITPVRVLDTRTGVGLSGPFVSPTGRTVQLTGTVPTSAGPAVVVPAGATAVVLNVTAVLPQADGFISVRPGGTPGAPETSSLNFAAGAIVPNSVTVALSAGGAIDVVYDAFGTPGPTTDALIDVVGYTTDTAIQGLVADLATKANSADVYTKSQTDTALATKANSADVYTKSHTDAALATKANSADVYTKGQTDTALATKADIDQVRTAMLADKVWTARVSSTGTKLSSGPYTSARFATGYYGVTFNVADLEIPNPGAAPIAVVTGSCFPSMTNIYITGWTFAGGQLTSFRVEYDTRGADGLFKDCGAHVHVKFADLNTGSPIGPLSTESRATTAATPEGATCTTDGDTTTCTMESDEPRDDTPTAGP